MPLPMVQYGIDRFIKQRDSGYRQRMREAGAGRMPELSAA